MRKIVVIFIIVVMLLFSAFYLVYNKYLGDINSVKITEDDDELNISSELNNIKNITNIALFGIDTREKNYDGSRADTLMIATVDKKHNKLKLTSIMRDTYVSIPENKNDKINHSYAYGGPELTIKTINQNFDMNIKDYVTVNFTALEKIVEVVDGVEINVKSNEVDHLNGILDELDELAGNKTKQIKSSGLQNLTGRQALAYCRIRYTGNGDYERTERQRAVLEKVVAKVLSNKSLPQALSLIEAISPYIETSLSKREMVGLATSVFTSGIREMEDTRLPLDDYSKTGTWDGVFYLKFNTLSDNVIHLHKFIYEDEDYIPTSVVERISNKLR